MITSVSDSVSGGDAGFDPEAASDEDDDRAPSPLDTAAEFVGTNVARRGNHPAVATVAVLVGAYAVLTLIMLTVGTMLTHWWVPSALGHWDEAVNRWFAGHRTPFLDHVTAAATFMANTVAVVVLALIAAVVMVLLRRWRNALVLAVALVLEVTVFLSTTFAVGRPRPNVVRLDSTPTTASFPSGHIAASLVLWGAIALCVTTFHKQRVLAVLVWCIAIVAPLAIGFARVYRGMHHWTDVAAGAFLGLAALTSGVLAERATSVAMAARRYEAQPSAPDAGIHTEVKR
jgi:undecaprenyl-diphosphatase